MRCLKGNRETFRQLPARNGTCSPWAIEAVVSRHPREATIELAAVLAMVPHKASDMHHSRSICGDQRKEDPRVHFVLKCRVPNCQGFLLEGSKMSKTRKQEYVDVFRIIWPRNNPSNKNVLLLITYGGRQIQQDPDVNPACRFLLGIELSTIN